jgi:PAS domain S-box-containing protein
MMNEMDQQMYQLFFDQNPDAIVKLDLDGQVMAANSALLVLAEGDFADFDGIGFSSFYQGADANLVDAAVQRALSGTLQRFEATMLTKKGNEITTQVSIFPIAAEGKTIAICALLRDVTAEAIQKRILQDSILNSQRNQELLKAIVEHAEEGIAVADLEGHFLIYNQTMVDLIGVQQKDSRTHDWSNLYNIHNQHTRKIVPKSELPIVKAMKGESVKNEVYLIKNPIRGDVYLSISSSPIRDQDGRIIAGMVIDRDITEQTNYEKELKKAIEELKQSNLRFKYAAQAASDAIWDLNLVTRECYWGDGFKNLFGHDVKDVLDEEKFWLIYVAAEDQNAVVSSVKEALHDPSRNLWNAQFRFKKSDGTFAMVTDTAIIIRDAQGKAVRMVGAMQDNTRMKLEEQRLKLMESVVTNTIDAVMISDIIIRPGLGPEIIYVNSAFSSMTGYSVEDILLLGPQVLYGEKTDLEILNHLWTAMAARTEVEVELICYTKSAEEFWVQMVVLPVQDSTGTYSHFVTIIRNITDRKVHELEKEQFIEGLTRKNKDLKQFTYITSHNLRSPLANLTGLIGLLDDIEVDNEALKVIHDNFRVSTESLISTVNDLMDILNTKDNQLLQIEENQVSVVLDHVVKLLGKHVTDIDLQILCDFNDARSIKFHKAYFESIIMNLLTNAIKYRAPDRQLIVEIDTRLVDSRIVLTFKDNGTGFDLERHRDRIFGFYQKFHNHPDSKGLGLYLVKSQMEDLGGTVDIKSIPNVGTTLILNFKA